MTTGHFVSALYVAKWNVFWSCRVSIVPTLRVCQPSHSVFTSATSPLLWALEGHHQHAQYRPAQARLHTCELLKAPFHSFRLSYISISPSLLYHILLLYRRRWEIHASLHPHGHDSKCPSLYRGCGNFLFSCVTPTAPSIWRNNHSSWNMLMLSLMLFKWPLLQ